VSASILTTCAASRLCCPERPPGRPTPLPDPIRAGDGGLAALAYDPANSNTKLTQTQAPLNANFSINGFAATSPSNVVTGHHRRDADG